MRRSGRDEVVHFLKEQVIGRAVAAPATVTRDGPGGFTTAYEEDVIYGNLAETARGFSFDLTTLARGTRYVPAKDGKGEVAEGSMNSVRVIRYDMTERRSSGELLGHARLVSTTNPEDPLEGVTFLVRIELVGDGLEVSEQMTGYADIQSVDGQFQPIAIDGTYRYRMEKRLLVVEYQQKNHRVDPRSLARSATGEHFALQVSREVAFPTPLGEPQVRAHSQA